MEAHRVDFAYSSMQLFAEFNESVRLLGDVLRDDRNGLEYRIEYEDGKGKLESGPKGEGHTWHGEFELDLVGPLYEIIDHAIGADLGFGANVYIPDVEEFVLGLYMHDDTRETEIVTALGRLVNNVKKEAMK